MTTQPYHAWTDDERAQVKQLWKDGLSAKQISEEIGGVSRNAVIGLIHRGGLKGQGARAPAQHDAPKPRRTKPRKPKPRRKINWSVKAAGESLPPEPVVALKVSTPEPVSLRLSLTELAPHQCKWPEGDGPFTFCGAPCFGPYCEHHRKRAYQPLVPRRIREPA